MKQFIANFILYSAINFSGMYTKYLTDRAQRLAFIETHKAMEHKKESEKEYQRTQKLLDSSEYISYNFLTCVGIIMSCPWKILLENVKKLHEKWIENWYTIIISTLEYFITKFRVIITSNSIAHIWNNILLINCFSCWLMNACMS